MKKTLSILLLALTACILISCHVSEDLGTITPPFSSLLPTLTFEEDIKLNHKEITLSVGQSDRLIPEATKPMAENDRFIFTSSDSSCVYIDQDGNFIGMKEGTAIITVKTKSGLENSCKVIVNQVNDPFETLDISSATEIYWPYYYGDGIYLDDKGQITFSPTIWDFQQQLKFNNTGYYVYLRITHLSSTELPKTYTFPTIAIIPEKSKVNESTMDLFLTNKDNLGTFCPIAGERYDIEFIIAKKKTSETFFYGKFESVLAANTLSQSTSYNPSFMPGYVQKDEGESYITYIAGEGGQIDGGDLQAHPIGKEGYEVTAKAAQGYKFLMWNDGSKETTRTDVAKEKDTKYTAYFIKTSRDDMPIANMYIFTETGYPVTSKNYTNAQMSIVGASKEKYDISASLQIKGRGNSSWNPYASQTDYDSKNSYTIKLDEQEKLLGIGDSKNRDWVLNSNKFDLSGLRNYLIWQFANKMGTIPYVTECEWVQLYINGEYRGMYMVTERVEAANDRVEVDDKLDSTDKGYLVEIDFRGTDEGQPYFYVEGYGSASNGNPREFVVKSECSDEDLEFIAAYIRNCHSALISGDKEAIDALVDIPSLIDMYIIEELTKDVDVGAASFFMQKSPGGKIYFTAPWDFDFGFGTYGKAVSYEEMVSIGDEGCTWFARLIEHEWFRKAVLDRMSELDDDFLQTLNDVEAKAAELRTSADKNAEFWNMYGNKYHAYVSSGVSYSLNNYKEHIDFIVDWSKNRWDYMKTFLRTY